VRIASVSLDKAEAMIVTNDRNGAAEAARHLADLGHRRIAFVSGPTSFRSSHERREGFAAGLAEKGLKLAADDVVFGAYTFESGLACGAALLQRRPRPTAVFCGNDEMAAGVYRAAREASLEIPRDLSVVGYDDSPVAAKVWPPLTTVKLPIREMGRIAAEKLLSGAVEGFKGRIIDAKVAPSLVVRESTAAPAGR
jgi:LacI family transcriptional regulator